ncbi:hypothetical protein K469DRAFT_438703, partial [Zopfia rhizophila CBS 207.26]
GFVPDPDGRGTVSIVVSCLLTLLLCVWQALHLNVPKRGETLWEKLVTNILWITVGIYAPELVVFTAWRQWSSARLLGKIATEEQNKVQNSLDNREDNGEGKGSGDVHIEKTTKRRVSHKRKYKWTGIHSFFASTGGFAFEIDDTFDEKGALQTPFLSAECPRRLTLTARGVALLAKCGLLPDIPEEEIRDKSKANTLAKALVVLQAGWMLVQVIGRLIDRLPVTLLEVNTVAHVLCAFSMYTMWWNKPLLPEEPLILKGDWVHPLCAYMFMSSEMSEKVDKPKIHSRSVVKRLFASLKVYLKIPELERLRIRLNSNCSHNDDNITLTNPGGSIKATLKRKSDAHPTFTLSSKRSLENLRSIREARKSSETAFFERRPRITAADRASTPPTQIHLRRWKLAAGALQTYPILRDQSFILHSHAPQTSIDEEDISNQVCIHCQPTELLKPYIQNWLYDDLLRNVGGLTVSMILWLSNFIYGSLHAAAWNEHFPTTAEKWLWRASCSYISFAGGLWIILNWVAAAYPPLNEFWERWMDGAKGRIWSIFLGIVVFVCGFSFAAARVYLVLEAFISIRDLPRKAYDTPDWTQMVPH